jgi:two-component system LytT family sensor kinase
MSNILLGVAGYITANTYRNYRPDYRNGLQALGWIVVLTAMHILAIRWLMSWLLSGNEAYLSFLQQSLPLRTACSLLMIAFMTVISWLWFYIKEEEKNDKRKEYADTLLREAELSRLRQQLQPHFLFNSLNSISALAGSQPEQARKMIQQLSDFLRGTLKKDEQQLVMLSEEMEHLGLYLEIEKVRFGHRLNTRIQIEDGVLSLKLPSLLLQPIVENAIKFGLYDTVDAITIHLNAYSKNGELNINVINPYDPATANPKQGIGFGLSSVQQRLNLLYARHDLLITSANDKEYTTTIKIPQR